MSGAAAPAGPVHTAPARGVPQSLESREQRAESGERGGGTRALRVALFTDTLGDINGVSRFVRSMAAGAAASGRRLDVITSTRIDRWGRLETGPPASLTNFRPLAAMAMPGYPELELALPPVGAMIRHARALAPGLIHISTPGPVGLAGRLAARLLRVPVVGVYHTDFPAYVEHLFGDPALTRGAGAFMRGFYRGFQSVLTRSAASAAGVRRLGIDAGRVRRVAPGVDTESFHPRFRDGRIWGRLGGSARAVRVLYIGRVSVEKNLPFLAGVWRGVHARLGPRAELVIVGDGPYRARMERELEGAGARFLGFRHGRELSALYASGDLFVFPSLTDTLGQVVLEAQASGLPVLVADRGGPREVVRDGVTGMVLPGPDARRWAGAIEAMVVDAGARRRMGAAARSEMEPRTIRASFEDFWAAHEEVGLV